MGGSGKWKGTHQGPRTALSSLWAEASKGRGDISPGKDWQLSVVPHKEQQRQATLCLGWPSWEPDMQAGGITQAANLSLGPSGG